MQLLDNASILITGGTGSFGKAFVKTVLAKYPKIKRLVVYSRDELKQFEMDQVFSADEYKALRYFIGDIRDADRLRRAMEGIDVVIHAAALKQVPAAEYNPFECIKTNVLGAQNVIDACLDSGVKRVVALSTDKAAAPINLYGATKLCSDKLFVSANNIKGHRDLRFSVVRYGNVMGSRGSVIPFFQRQRQNGVLPITDPDMTRFNISLQEGVDMVLWCVEHALGGEILVPKIPSYRITDVATAIAPECEQKVVGIRPGEKLHEEMITASDSFNCVDLGDYYAVLPSGDSKLRAQYMAQQGAKMVEPGFSYDSGSNSEFLSVEQMRALIDEHAPQQHMIPYGRQDITQADIDAVVEVLQSDFLTQGPQVPRFEAALASYCGAAHGVAVNSATSALHIACLALDLGPGDWLWTSPVTFVASANCGLYCGAQVDFVDIDPKTYNPRQLEAKLRQAEQDGRLPKVVIPVHLTGQSCDMAAIHALSQRYGFRIIEDASHAVGGRYQQRPIGGCQYSDITVFSFHPVKIITTAEGGLALCNNAELAQRMQDLRSHGITRDAQRMHANHGPWYYEQLDLGFNYRMTEMQAALGCSQLQRLDRFIAKRHAIAAIYDQAFTDLPLQCPWQHADSYSAFHLYVIQLQDELADRRAVFERLRAAGIGVNVHYIPVHLQPYYQAQGFRRGQFPASEHYYARAISLPMYPGMSGAQQEEVIRQLTAALAA